MVDDIESIIRRVVREELERSRGDAAEQATSKRAYTVQSMSEAYEVSVSYIRNDIATGRLRPQYLGRKPLIGIDEAQRWFAALPPERPVV
ncbi:hypothetical protein EDF52_10312 [Curtobacterium sp. PhB42]|uniref:hypothetical protein n=1 Tax=unclassified Curtobacterium TaxID=257496 RepID=UPI0010624B32|nr:MULTISPECIES: hypothetical protein [unclassified Curtobacterium]TDW50451.1 hypothetical protein EDF52_10312 [Curtobacterium sp. PhB42]TDW55246.1 hypothetical protein EDF47_106298 [Curtobacterium sp. PhB190]